VKRYGKYGRKVGWIVKWYGKYERKVSWNVKWYGKTSNVKFQTLRFEKVRENEMFYSVMY
jgi:hypothetical protein